MPGLQDDEGVNHVLDTALVREGNYTRNKCIALEVELTYMEVLDLNTVQGEIPQFTGREPSTCSRSSTTRCILRLGTG